MKTKKQKKRIPIILIIILIWMVYFVSFILNNQFHAEKLCNLLPVAMGKMDAIASGEDTAFEMPEPAFGACF